MNLSTLVVENCPNVDFLSIADSVLSSANALKYARCTNIDATKPDFNILNKLSRIKGIGDNGEYTETAYLSGKYVVLKAIEEDIERMKSLYPYLSISARTTLKTIFVTFKVTSQYGAIKGATVEINDLTYDLSSGTVKVPLAEGIRYGYVIRYSGSKDTGTITPSSDTTISKSYEIELDIMTMKPEPNGKMQLLVKGTAIYITLYSGSGIVTDWGDGTTNSELSHTYTDGNSLHNISINSANDRIASVYFNKSYVIAFWGIGKSKARISEFESQSSLEYITDDLFYNGYDNVQTFFKDCSKLKEIPAKLFAPIPELTNIYGYYNGCMFWSCYSLKEIPAGLFDPLVNLESVGSLFCGCSSLEKIPAGLFDKLVKVNFREETSSFGLFQECSKLEEFPYNLFDKNVKTWQFKNVFKRTALKVGFLPLCKESNISHKGIYEDCINMQKLIARTDTPCTIDSQTIPDVSQLKIYVPDSAIETYKAATNWSAYKDKIVGWSELTEEERQKYGLNS